MESKETISTRFRLVSEPGNKAYVIAVNRFLPLINYKRQI